MPDYDIKITTNHPVASVTINFVQDHQQSFQQTAPSSQPINHPNHVGPAPETSEWHRDADAELEAEMGEGDDSTASQSTGRDDTMDFGDVDLGPIMEPEPREITGLSLDLPDLSDREAKVDPSMSKESY